MVLSDLRPLVQDEDSTGIEGDSAQHKAVELLWETQEAMDMPVSKATSARGHGHYPVRVKVVKAADLRRVPLQALQSLVVGCAWQFIQQNKCQRSKVATATDLEKVEPLNARVTA